MPAPSTTRDDRIELRASRERKTPPTAAKKLRRYEVPRSRKRSGWRSFIRRLRTCDYGGSRSGWRRPRYRCKGRKSRRVVWTFRCAPDPRCSVEARTSLDV